MDISWLPFFQSIHTSNHPSIYLPPFLLFLWGIFYLPPYLHCAAAACDLIQANELQGDCSRMLWERMTLKRRFFVKVGPCNCCRQLLPPKGQPDEADRLTQKGRTHKMVKKWNQNPDDIYYLNHLDTGFSVTCSINRSTNQRIH